MDVARRSLMIGLAGTILAAGCEPQRSTPRRVELRVASDGDELTYKPSHLTCPTGALVRLSFDHAGEILSAVHDWVLLRPGMRTAFLADAIKPEIDALTLDRAMVLVATPMCARGQSVTIEFTAPAPGEYPFVCSVAGHGETMSGILTVTN